MGFKGSGQKQNDISTNTIISIDYNILINGKESSANCCFYGFNDPSTQQNVNPAVNAPVVSLMMARGPVWRNMNVHANMTAPSTLLALKSKISATPGMMSLMAFCLFQEII